MCALFPEAVGTGGDGLMSDPPKNCIVFQDCFTDLTVIFCLLVGPES